jgi:hypothetical protein
MTITPWMHRDEETGELLREFPYGSLPRLLLIYLTSEALRTKNKRVDLGESVWSFLQEIGYKSKQSSTYRRLQNQAARLFNCSIRFSFLTDEILGGKAATVADDFLLWWDHKKEPSQPKLIRSHVILSDRFFRDLQEHGFPVDLDIIRAFHASPIGLDIYVWLTYRLKAINETGQPMRLAWNSLRWQFGGEFARGRDFKRQLLETLTAIRIYWPALAIEDWGGGIIINPCRRSVDRLL